MEYRVSVGGIEWSYTETLCEDGDLAALTRSGAGAPYTESDLSLLAAQLNDEIARVALISLHPKGDRFLGGYESVIVDQVRDALSDFPELFTQEENSASEKQEERRSRRTKGLL